jgi:putative SOS response-associated peptidase YedK
MEQRLRRRLKPTNDSWRIGQEEHPVSLSRATCKVATLRWKDPESGEWLRTCTIITGEPNELVAQIHPRMPVILPEQHHAAWLGETDDGNLKALLLPTLPIRWELFNAEPTETTTDALELLRE